MKEEKSKCYDEGTLHACRGGMGVDFIFSPEVTPTTPEDVVGRGGVVREFGVEIPRVGIESEVFEVLG
jgi:hypothetical protein